MSHPMIEAKLERDLVAPLLRRVLLTIVVAASLTVITSVVFHIARIVPWGLANAFVAGTLLLVARRGHVRLASLLEVLTLVITTIYTLTSGYGILDVGLLIFPVIFLLSSVLLSTGWIVVVVMFASATVVFVGLAQKHGLLVTPVSRLVEYDDIIDAIVILGTMAAFVHYLVAAMRRAVLEARWAHENTSGILDATNEAIFIHDPRDGRIVYVNEPTLEMFGQPREAFLGQAPADPRNCPAPHGPQGVIERIQRAVTEGTRSFEWLARRQDGSALWVEVALRSANIAGEPRVVAVVRDITQRRRLEQRVREAETFRAVGQLAGGIAHDFNNQLVGILGHAEFLQETLPKDSELRECADAILVSGQRAADLTRKLLAFARKGRRRNVALDLHELVVEVITLGKRSIDKRITLEQQLDAPEVIIKGDPSALQNAILNLLFNARDSMPRGGVVRFSTKVVDSTETRRESGPALALGRYIALTVSDTGVGIPPNIISRIFEPFFTTKESGTGMGLAAVQGTVLEHHGAVEVESEPGRGTSFRLLFPLSEETLSREPPSIAPVKPSPSYRILVVDDEAAVATVVRRTLERSGHSVVVCENGQEALNRYRSDEFDLVLLDVMMPDLDGIEVLRRLRLSEPKVKVILMTGHAGESVESRLQETSDVPVLSKPFQPKELLEELRKILADGAPPSR